jgi:hypothetical protein
MNYAPSAVGLDLEWPYTSGRIGGAKEGKVALVQLCDAEIILLIQVSKMERVYTWFLLEVSSSSLTSPTRISRESESARVFIIGYHSDI